jgi:hypothetical protein
VFTLSLRSASGTPLVQHLENMAITIASKPMTNDAHAIQTEVLAMAADCWAASAEVLAALADSWAMSTTFSFSVFRSETPMSCSRKMMLRSQDGSDAYANSSTHWSIVLSRSRASCP